jgi:hypothetical protein
LCHNNSSNIVDLTTILVKLHFETFGNEFTHGNGIILVATLALGSQPRQRGYKVVGQVGTWESRQRSRKGAGQEEAWESHHTFLKV